MTYLQEPDNAQLERIREELGENPEKLQHSLQLLQQWISCQPHLPQDYDNSILPVFLRGCKHNLERAKRKLEMYFIARAKVPELFGDRDVTSTIMERYTKSMKIAVVPKLTPEGHRVTIYKIMDPEGNQWDVKDALRYAFITADIRILEEHALAGDIFIYDLEHMGMRHVVKYISPLLKKAYLAANEAYPQRLNQLHFVNVPSAAEKVISVTRALMKEKIRNRFFSHSTVDKLLNYVPKDMLPFEYGGTYGTFDDAVGEWTSFIWNHKKWLKQQDDVKATGPIPEDVYKFDDINGLQGSFRQLGID